MIVPIDNLFNELKRRKIPALLAAVNQLFAEAEPYTPVDTGGMKDPQNIEIKVDGDGVSLEYKKPYARFQYGDLLKGSKFRHIVNGDKPGRIRDNAPVEGSGMTRYRRAYSLLRQSKGSLKVLPNQNRWLVTTLKDDAARRRIDEVFVGVYNR